MRIKLWVKDLDTGKALEDLGTCLTDAPGRAVQDYNQDQAWIDKGYHADIAWKDVTDPAAASLGKRGGKSTSPAKRAASAANGQHGGRPRKTA